MTAEQEAKLAMCMRVIEVFRKNGHVMEDMPELKGQVLELKVIVDNIFGLLTSEEQDRALDRYREDLEYLETMDTEEPDNNEPDK